MDRLLERLTELPPVVLNLVLGAIAAVENFFPPIPADMVVAFGAFLAARARRDAWPVLVVVLLGNVGGAIAMFALGRRYGSAWIRRRLRLKGDAAESRMRRMYDRWGVPALFLSRFLPGVRAVVPPLAGALRVPTVGALVAIAMASTIWYGAITLLAFQVGSSWAQVQGMIVRFGRGSAVVAAAIALVAVIAWLLLRRGRR